MSTPIETAAAKKNPGLYEDPPDVFSVRMVHGADWRDLVVAQRAELEAEVRSTFASLAQHRDDIARVILDAWSLARATQRVEDVADVAADAVLAYLTGEAS